MIEPLDFDKMNGELTGVSLSVATQDATRQITAKLNEVIATVNEMEKANERIQKEARAQLRRRTAKSS